MFEALLHGKLSREQENMEDLLTSMIFETFEAAPVTLLESFLATATTADGARPLGALPPLRRVDYEYWPWLAEDGCHPCEPDVLLRLVHADDTTTDVLVEVKYRSRKSTVEDEKNTAVRGDVGSEEAGVPPRDQLAREWSNLLRHSNATRKWVAYATTSLVRPHRELAASQEVLGDSGNLCWAPITRIHALIVGTADATPPTRKLAQALERLGIIGFEGLPDLDCPMSWRFARPLRSFDWSRSPLALWKIRSTSRPWQWDYASPHTFTWRYQ